jgi:hypothetical protein
MTTIDYTPEPLTDEQRRAMTCGVLDRMLREARQQDAAERNRAAREAEALSRAAQGRECK